MFQCLCSVAVEPCRNTSLTSGTPADLCTSVAHLYPTQPRVPAPTAGEEPQPARHPAGQAPVPPAGDHLTHHQSGHLPPTHTCSCSSYSSPWPSRKSICLLPSPPAAMSMCSPRPPVGSRRSQEAGKWTGIRTLSTALYLHKRAAIHPAAWSMTWSMTVANHGATSKTNQWGYLYSQ